MHISLEDDTCILLSHLLPPPVLPINSALHISDEQCLNFFFFFVRKQKSSHIYFGSKGDCGPLAWGQDSTFSEEEHFDGK